jgi:phosphoserine aminotransferase
MLGTPAALRVGTVRKLNFSGGPGALPDCVLEAASEAILEVPGQGLSLLGISHRSPWFRDVVEEAEANLRALLDLSRSYYVLFLQGGGTLQFSMIPMSLLRGRAQPADYLHTGYWSGKAIPEARREGAVNVVWSGEEEGFRRLPRESELAVSAAPEYLHYISNETVEGLQFHRVVGREDLTRICDMSSDFLSRRIDAGRFSLIYAHAQKNLGPAGVTVVLVREDLLERIPANLPAMLDFRNHVRMGSIYNTPPVFAIYVTMLITRWLRDEVGGLQAMERLNRAKAQRLYETIDSSQGFYAGRAAVPDRSLMNVAFTLPTAELNVRFVEQADAEGFAGLAGHRTLGGVRASLYNGVTLEAVEALCGFMDFFRERYRREAL